MHQNNIKILKNINLKKYKKLNFSKIFLKRKNN
jgi:hypothetical protein